MPEQGGGETQVSPRVLIDGTDRGGVNRYVDGLVRALDRAGADIGVACQRSDADRYGRMAPSAAVMTGPTAIAHRPARLAWEQTGLPVLADSFGADVIHAPFYTMPVRAGRSAVVVTVHDVTVFTTPDLMPPVKATFLRSAIRTAVRRAKRIIVPSKATRDELVEHLSADPTQIDVAYHGVDHELFRRPEPHECERVSNRLGLHGQPYIAFLGGFEPRKNVPDLIRGWIRAVADRDDPPALVLAGSRGTDDALDDAVAEVPEHLRLVRPGFLRYVDLPAYLGGARAVAFPSHGEGFGLPVLEAMACGAPVLTTHRTSLPEVGGEAVAYTEPDADSIAAGLTELLDDDARRAALANAGYDRSQEFTWQTSAETHLASYRRAVGD